MDHAVLDGVRLWIKGSRRIFDRFTNWLPIISVKTGKRFLVCQRLPFTSKQLVKLLVAGQSVDIWGRYAKFRVQRNRASCGADPDSHAIAFLLSPLVVGYAQ